MLSHGTKTMLKLKNHRQASHHPPTHYWYKEWKILDAGDEEKVSKDTVAIGTGRR